MHGDRGRPRQRGGDGSLSRLRQRPAPVAGHWYPKALASKLFGTDLDPATADIRARFNVNLGQAGCLTGVFFYLGLDNNHGANIDLVTVLEHEFAHGLGFQTFTNGSTGALLASFPSIWDDFLLDTTTAKTWTDMTAARARDLGPQHAQARLERRERDGGRSDRAPGRHAVSDRDGAGGAPPARTPSAPRASVPR